MYSQDQNILKEKLNDRYAILAKYMGNNRLKLNDDKRHLLIMTTRQKQRLINNNVQNNTPNEEIKPIKSEKLLGIFSQDDLDSGQTIYRIMKKVLSNNLPPGLMLSG